MLFQPRQLVLLARDIMSKPKKVTMFVPQLYSFYWIIIAAVLSMGSGFRQLHIVQQL